MLVLLVIALLGCVSALSDPVLYSPFEAKVYFQKFKRDHKKVYSSKEEESVRFLVFKDNLMKANEFNKNSSHAVFGVTQFMDLTAEEFSSMHKGFIVSGDASKCKIVHGVDAPKVNSPDSLDWRQKGVVTGVKDQARCGSCWAFSTTGNIEGQYAIKHKKLQQFSEQQLVDCDDNDNGCNGGFMTNAMTKLMELGGSETEQDYPYAGQVGQCHFDEGRINAKIVGCTNYQSTSPDKLKDIVYSTGPIAVGLVADSLQTYHGGIMDAATCGDGDIDHAVLLVGYGTESGKPYWILKNSWNTAWGEQGYFRIERSNANACKMINKLMASAIVG